MITADAVHGGREGGGGVADKGVCGGGRGHRENCFMAFNYLNNMSSKCITDLNH